MKSFLKSELFLNVCSLIFVMTLFGVVVHFAGPDHPLGDEETAPMCAIGWREWLMPVAYGFGAYIFAGLVLFLFHEFLFRIDSSIIEAEREYVKRQRANAVQKMMVFAGMIGLGVAFLYYSNILGIGAIVVINVILSLADRRYWE